MRKTKIEEYFIEMKRVMVKLFPDLKEETLSAYIKDEIKKSLKDFNFGVSYQNSSLSFLKFDKWIVDTSPIMTGFGTFFNQHEGSYNLLSDLCISFKDERKVYKANMFENMNNGNTRMEKFYKSMQGNIKILNNSIFGAAGASTANSFLYNPIISPSITYAGEDIITVSLTAIERFIGGNLYFYNISQIIHYIITIEDEFDYDIEEFVKINRKVNIDDIIDFLLSHFKYKNTEEEYELLKTVLLTYSEEQLQKIYFKNNLYEFLLRTTFLDDYIKQVIGKEFTDPNEPSEDIKEPLDKIWEVLRTIIFHNIQYYDRFDIAFNEKRNTVLHADTDSNFIKFDDFYYIVREYFKDDFKEYFDSNSIISKLSTINILSYSTSKMIEDTFDKFLLELNIKDKKYRDFISMKNEFTYSRILFTENKKQYAGMIVCQEGNVFKQPKLDVKGLPFKKVSVNKDVRNTFTDILEQDILKEENINRGVIFRKFKELEQVIKKSLLNGETIYSIPGKANSPGSYKNNPISIMSYRGIYTWNTLFPESEISLPAKVNMFKLKMGSDLNSIRSVIEETNELNTEQINAIIHKLEIVLNEVSETKAGNIDIISLPKTTSQFPSILIPFIDIETMVNDNINNGLILLKSLDFKTIEKTNGNFPTNIISL